MLLLAASQGAAAVAAGGAGGPAGGVRQDVQLDAVDDAVWRQRIVQPPVVLRSGTGQSQLLACAVPVSGMQWATTCLL